MICRWTQELLGYSFTIIQRPSRMMGDMDALSRRFGKAIATHFLIAYILSTYDKTLRLFAYDPESFHQYSRLRKKTNPVPTTYSHFHYILHCLHYYILFFVCSLTTYYTPPTNLHSNTFSYPFYFACC